MKIFKNDLRYATFYVTRRKVLLKAQSMIENSTNEDFKHELQHYTKCYSENPKNAKKFLSFLNSSRQSYLIFGNEELKRALDNEISLMSENFGTYKNSIYNKSIDAATIVMIACIFCLKLQKDVISLMGKLSFMDVLVRCFFTAQIFLIVNAIKVKTDEEDFDYIETPAYTLYDARNVSMQDLEPEQVAGMQYFG